LPLIIEASLGEVQKLVGLNEFREWVRENKINLNVLCRAEYRHDIHPEVEDQLESSWSVLFVGFEFPPYKGENIEVKGNVVNITFTSH